MAASTDYTAQLQLTALERRNVRVGRYGDCLVGDLATQSALLDLYVVASLGSDAAAEAVYTC